MYLKDAWYVAGFSYEVAIGRPLGRVFLGQPVLLYRNSKGNVCAIGNRCPHRSAPLDMGQQVGDDIQCLYHGLKFNSSGVCVHNPHAPGNIPRAAKVPSYPLLENNGLLWIWMGQGEADFEKLQVFECLDPSENAVGFGYLHGNANYELMVDNIMDLSHVAFIHPGLGSEAVSRAAVTMQQDGDIVSCIRKMTNEILPETLQKVYQTGAEPVNRSFHVQWHAPSNMHLIIDIENAVPTARTIKTGSEVLHMFTPETEFSTHYFYVGTRKYDIKSAEMTERFLTALGLAFNNEDKPIIEAQQRMVGTKDLMDLGPVMLSIDGAAVRVRRLLKSKIDGEVAASKAAKDLKQSQVAAA